MTFDFNGCYHNYQVLMFDLHPGKYINIRTIFHHIGRYIIFFICNDFFQIQLLRLLTLDDLSAIGSLHRELWNDQFFCSPVSNLNSCVAYGLQFLMMLSCLYNILLFREHLLND